MSAHVSAGADRVTVRLSCPPPETSCAGTVRLETATKVPVKARRRVKHEVLTLGRRSFRFNRQTTITVGLNSAGRALLAKKGRLTLRVIVAAHAGSGKPSTTAVTVTLRAGRRR